MCYEEKPGDRCEGLITLPAEWHKKKVFFGWTNFFYAFSLAGPGDVLSTLLLRVHGDCARHPAQHQVQLPSPTGELFSPT